MKRTARGMLLALALAASLEPCAAADGPASTVRLYADTDDDDDDGVADRDDPRPDRARDVEWLRSDHGVLRVRSVLGDAVRILLGERVLSRSSGEAARVGLEGVRPGVTRIDFSDRTLEVVVCELRALDEKGAAVSLATSHASLSRVVPLVGRATAGEAADADALSWLLVCPKGSLPSAAGVRTTRPSGDTLDAIERAPLLRAACPPSDETFECGKTEPIRLTADLVDRQHPAISGRSLRAEVGGRVTLEIDGRKAGSLRVGGPRETSLGEIDRFRGSLRFHVIRASAGGQPAVGGGDRGAVAIAREEARTASMLWGQCGIHFGPDENIAVDVVDPPPRYLVAVGCDLGIPASGGVITLGVEEETIRVSSRPGDSPVSVAHAIASAAGAAGFGATVSPNARVLPGSLRTADVLVRRPDGALAEVRPIPSTALSTDATLGICLGEVNLGDGLAHFEDLDAAAGTVEERTLMKAYQDGDPSTIDVFVIPSFSKTGRIGESFIDADGSSIQNAIMIDRAGIRSGARSYALAHEIGHVLLDMPGHPDDFGVDRPWVLMDADAADPTIFGPRRLSTKDCERAILQSGPGSAVPLLERWPTYRKKARVGEGSNQAVRPVSAGRSR